jgi:chromate reductase, NAD(P)H dehydrogenase (quinone)
MWRSRRRSGRRWLVLVGMLAIVTTNEVLMMSGSLRAGSTNTAVLQTEAEVAPSGTMATVFDHLSDLPHFNPDLDTEPLPPAVADLRAAVRRADALLVSTPEYAGALPGSFKNALDWLVGGTEITNKPTAWINVSSSPTQAAGAHASLRTILGYVNAHIVEAACTHPITRAAVEPNGNITDPALSARVAASIRALVDHMVASQERTDPPPATSNERELLRSTHFRMSWWRVLAD